MHSRLLGPTLVTLLVCGGCDGPTSQSVSVGLDAVRSAQTSSPEDAAEAVFAEFRAGRVSGVMRAMMPASKLEEMERAWEETRKKPVSAAETAQFEKMMAMFTAKDAEDAIFAMVKPHLQEAQQQIAGLAMMFPMMASGMAEEAGAPAEAGQMLGAVGAKFADLEITSEMKARKAIRAVIAAMRALDLENPAAVQALEFDEMLGKMDILYGGIVDVLAVYGMSLDSTLGSIRVKTVAVTGDRANMEMSLELFGGDRQTVPFEMERVEGRWMFMDDSAKSPAGSGVGVAR